MYMFKGSKNTSNNAFTQFVRLSNIAWLWRNMMRDFVGGSKTRVIIHIFLYIIHPLHAVVISKFCVDHAHCIVYCIIFDIFIL